MTTANKITLLRVVAVPLFISQVLYYADTGHEYHRWFAVASFGFAAVFDGVDGFIARRFNQRSELGAILDPMADKMLLVSAVVLLSQNHEPHLDRIPLWLTATIIGRDVILTMGVVVIYYACGKVSVRPSLIGKAATVFQMGTALWILLRLPSDWLQLWFIGAGICTAVSGAHYFWEGSRQLSSSPTSAPTPGQGR